MLAGNLAIYLEIGKDTTIYYAKRKWICFTPPSLVRHAK